MRLLLILLAVSIVTVFTLHAFADNSNVSINISGGSQAGQNCVSAKNCYDPDTIAVLPKTLVIWTNTDVTEHTVTSGNSSENNTGTLFDSGTIGPGSTYSFVFLNPGTYGYFCYIHPWMTGEVIVENTANSATTPEFGPSVIIVFLLSVFATVFLVKNKTGLRF
jgi:plastocyanin